MFIYIDESGSFVPTTTPGSWNVIAALAVPEPARKKIELFLRDLKLSVSQKHTDEVKLKALTEMQLKAFLLRLQSLDSTVFVSCVDLGMEKSEAIAKHQKAQVDRILVNVPRMVHEDGRAMIADLAKRVERLSPQLYTQMVVQIDLLDQVYRSSLLYYSQRIPATLSSFRWRIDEKNSSRPLFEETMRHMAPPLLQSRSIENPAIFVNEFDYSHFDREFRYREGEAPTYLQEQYGLPINEGSNLGKVLRDFVFVRSHDEPGVQVADLLASTFRRALRGEFADSRGIAKMLGALMVQRAKPDPPLHLISLTRGGAQYAAGHAHEFAVAARANARPMLKRASRRR